MVKALFYTCSSYPKIAAPHRLSLSDDYEICMLSSITGSIGVYSDVVRVVLEFKRGERDIRRLDIGKNIAKALLLCFQDLGYKMSAEMCISAVILAYIDVVQTEIEKDFYRALRRVFNAIQVSEISDSIEFIRAMRIIGGNFNTLLDKAGISERKVEIEGLTLQHIFDELAKYDPLFGGFSNIQKVIDVIKLVDKIYVEHMNIVVALSKLSIEMVKDNINLDVPSDKLLELLKVDTSCRKKGIYLTYIMPYVAYSSLYLIKSK